MKNLIVVAYGSIGRGSMFGQEYRDEAAAYASEQNFDSNIQELLVSPYSVTGVANCLIT